MKSPRLKPSGVLLSFTNNTKGEANKETRPRKKVARLTCPKNYRFG